MLEVTVLDDGPGLRDGNALIEGRGIGAQYTRAIERAVRAEKHRFAVLNSHPGIRIEIGLPAGEGQRRDLRSGRCRRAGPARRRSP